MNQRLFLFALLATATACQREKDIQPNARTLSGEVAGTYQTNAYLDPSRVTLSASQLPYAQLRAESDTTVTLIYTTVYPARRSQRVVNVLLKRQADSIELRASGSTIGTLQADRIFMNNGMEKQGELLRLTLLNDSQRSLYFAGFK